MVIVRVYFDPALGSIEFLTASCFTQCLGVDFIARFQNVLHRLSHEEGLQVSRFHDAVGDAIIPKHFLELSHKSRVLGSVNRLEVVEAGVVTR